MELSIIIVNYKSPELIINCLQTVIDQTKNISFEIIIVDNNSDDESKELICTAFPQVVWIDMTYNAGFARANNAGIKIAKAEAILLLNPDTIILNEAIENCYLQFIQSGYGACGVQLLNKDLSPQISGNYFMKGGLNYLLPLPYLGTFLRAIAKFIKVKEPNIPNAKGIVEVDWINGAYLMVKKQVIDKTGLMDEDFFLYAEETEWCSRIKKISKLCIYGDIKIIHLQGETTGEVFSSTGKGYQNLFDKKGLQIMLSNLVRIRKQYGVAWFLFILAVYIFDIPIFFLGILFSKIFASKKYSFLDFEIFTKNVCKIVQFTPTIIRNKPHFYKVL